MIVSYAIEHTMRFEYAESAQDSVMTLYVCPIRDRAQVLREFGVRTDPDGALFEFIDSFGNTGHFLDRAHTHEHLAVTARSIVEVGPLAPDRLTDAGPSACRGDRRSPMVPPRRLDPWEVRFAPGERGGKDLSATGCWSTRDSGRWFMAPATSSPGPRESRPGPGPFKTPKRTSA